MSPVAKYRDPTSGLWLPSGTSIPHAALTGLAADDHPQYHTDARGDARYSRTGHAHSGVYAGYSVDGYPGVGGTHTYDPGYNDHPDYVSYKYNTTMTGAQTLADGTYNQPAPDQTDSSEGMNMHRACGVGYWSLLTSTITLSTTSVYQTMTSDWSHSFSSYKYADGPWPFDIHVYVYFSFITPASGALPGLYSYALVVNGVTQKTYYISNRGSYTNYRRDPAIMHKMTVTPGVVNTFNGKFQRVSGGAATDTLTAVYLQWLRLA